MDKEAAREKAWDELGLTMFRPLTPKEQREVFDIAFDAGWKAHDWRRIDTCEGTLPADGMLCEVTVQMPSGRRGVRCAMFLDGRFLVGNAPIRGVVAWKPHCEPFRENDQD